MAYTTPVRKQVGDEVTVAEYNAQLVDNIIYLEANLPTHTGTEDQVIVVRNGALAGLTVPADNLLVGSSGSPAALAIGSEGQTLTVTNGVPAWGAAPAISGMDLPMMLTIGAVFA